MSLWNPNSRSNSPHLTIQFNKQVSAGAYAKARDEVLMMKGVKVDSEDKKARTMVITGGSKDAIEEVSGVESCTRGKPGQSYGGGKHRL
jgi:hypothetical protein